MAKKPLDWKLDGPYIPLSQLLAQEVRMKCPHCEYEYTYSYQDGSKIEVDFFECKKHGIMQREGKNERELWVKEKMSLFGCPKCYKVFMD